jgi:FkbM family methyltransferase
MNDTAREPRPTGHATPGGPALPSRRPRPRGFLRRLQRRLERHFDRRDNWNNDNPATNGEWCLLDRVAPRLRLALDLGANVGDWTARLLAAQPACTVHAFEASPRTFPHLQRRLGQLPGVQLHAVGLGAAAGMLTFHDYGENSGLSSFVSREASVGLTPERILQVPVTTVDIVLGEIGNPHVDFVKIDTEGWELPILRGMVKTLQQRRVTAVQFEYGGAWIDAGTTLGVAAHWLGGFGYELYRLRPNAVERVHYHPQEYETFKYANFLALAARDVLRDWAIPEFQHG